MKELSAEVSERLRDRAQGEVGVADGDTPSQPARTSPVPAVSVTTPTTTPLDHKPIPPPIASKPKRKAGTRPPLILCVGRDV